MVGVRLDKWLWAARFFKTRGLSSDEIGRGRVSVNGHPAKASREVRVGGISRGNVGVQVAEHDNLNVLGMNFLSSLSRWSVEGRWLVMVP